MDSFNIAIISVLILVTVAAIFLVIFIVKYIRSKPIVTLTLVDQIYCDILIWTIIIFIAFNSALAGCHFNQR